MKHKTTTDAPSVYTPEVIELVRLGVGLLALLEGARSPRKTIEPLLQLLPRLYAQTLTLPAYLYDWEEDRLEEYVSEDSYDSLRARLASVLGEADAFLVPIIEEGVWRADCSQLTISECIADVYQHLGNLLGIIRAENTEAVPAAIGRYLLYFREYWGRQLLLALHALHEAHATLPEEDEDEEDNEAISQGEIPDLYSDLDDDDDEDY